MSHSFHPIGPSLFLGLEAIDSLFSVFNLFIYESHGLPFCLPCPFFLLSGCLSSLPDQNFPADPVEDFRYASREANRLREHISFNSDEKFPLSHDRHRLNDTLERKDKATDERFSRIEDRLESLDPPFSPMRWTVLLSDGSTAFAVSPGTNPIDGVWTFWAETGGRKIRQLVYSGRKLNGPAVTWNSEGKKASTGQYLNNQKHGPWIFYDENENALRTKNYLNGVLEQ
ncbi:MAG: hypothetical protein AAEJ57_03565 [Opitutales bacterium]